ncbi:MAG: glycosyltransferase family 2 protein [Pseudomonadota bacterium]
MSNALAETEDDSINAVTAIVVSYFTGPLLARSIASLRTQDKVEKVILVDNGNFPGDVEDAVAPENGAPVTVLSGHGNIGFAAACNLGAHAADSRLLLFLNPDAVMPENGVARMIEDASGLERPWMMGAKLVGPDGVEQQGSRRETLTPWRAFVELARLDRLAPQHPYFRRFNLHAHPCPDDVIEVPTLSGACFLLPKADFDAIGGMDEQYFLHVEDVDFCLRFSRAGGKAYFNPNISVPHFKSSSRANPVRIEARKTAGTIRYFNTHFSNAYPRPFLWLVAGALWTSFGILFIRRGFAKLLRLAGLRARIGNKGLRRARSMSARQSSR